MSDASVVAICLTADRPEMTRKVVECFTEQTHPKKRLLVYDTSASAPEIYPAFDAANVLYFHAGERDKTIGELRNEAIEFAQMAACPGDFDVVTHFDSDDYSHPNRIAEQVALLQSSGADCVGYNEMLFWRQPTTTQTPEQFIAGDFTFRGEAWLYRNPDPQYALGTSLCYWRKTWERRPFPATSQGEDMQFIAGRKVAATTALPAFGPFGSSIMAELAGVPTPPIQGDPRMIARIHTGNTSTAYKPEAMQREAQKRNGMWKRVPEWDKYCDGIFRSA